MKSSNFASLALLVASSHASVLNGRDASNNDIVYVTIEACPADMTPGTSTVTLAAPVPISTATSFATSFTKSFTTSISSPIQTTPTDSDLSSTRANIVSSSTTLGTATAVPTSTATDCSYPAGNLLINPGFNDGSFDGTSGWSPRGTGSYSNSITADAKCGPYAAQLTTSGAAVDSVSFGDISQRIGSADIDASKTYQIQTYVKFVSGDAANSTCTYSLDCYREGHPSRTGVSNVHVEWPVSSIPNDWTKFTVDCPPQMEQLTMQISLVCNKGAEPITIGVDETAMYPMV